MDHLERGSVKPFHDEELHGEYAVDVDERGLTVNREAPLPEPFCLPL